MVVESSSSSPPSSAGLALTTANLAALSTSGPARDTARETALPTPVKLHTSTSGTHAPPTQMTSRAFFMPSFADPDIDPVSDRQFIEASLQELDLHVRAFIAARRDYLRSPAEYSLDRLTIRRNVVNVICDRVLCDACVLEALGAESGVQKLAAKFVEDWHREAAELEENTVTDVASVAAEISNLFLNGVTMMPKKRSIFRRPLSPKRATLAGVAWLVLLVLSTLMGLAASLVEIPALIAVNVVFLACGIGINAVVISGATRSAENRTAGHKLWRDLVAHAERLSRITIDTSEHAVDRLTSATPTRMLQVPGTNPLQSPVASPLRLGDGSGSPTYLSQIDVNSRNPLASFNGSMAERSMDHSNGTNDILSGLAALPRNELGYGVLPDDSIMDMGSVGSVAVIIGLTDTFKISHWNHMASKATGVQPESAMGEHILSFVEEKHVEALTRFRERNGGTMSTISCVSRPYNLKLLSSSGNIVTLYSVFVSLCRLRDKNGKLKPFSAHSTTMLVLGHLKEDFARSRLAHSQRLVNSLLGAFLEEETNPDHEVLDNICHMGTTVMLNRISETEFERVERDELLAKLVKDRIGEVDVIVHSDVPDRVEVAAAGLVSVLEDMLQRKEPGVRCTITLKMASVAHLNDERLLIVTVRGGFGGGRATSVVKDGNCKQRLAYMASVATATGDTILIRAPTISTKAKRGSNGSAGSSMASSVKSLTMTTGEALTLLVFESNRVMRTGLGSMLWSLGHAVVYIESSKGVERALRARRKIDAVIINMEEPGGQSIWDMLKARLPDVPMAASFTTVNNPEARTMLASGQAVLERPFKKSSVMQFMRRAVQAAQEATMRAAELEKQRQLFKEHRNGEWDRGQLLGKGSFGMVYEAVVRLTGARMAVKVINIDEETEGGESLANELINEIRINTTLQHPNIVHYFYCERKPGCVNLFMELCSGGSLKERMEADGPMTAPAVARALKQILSAVAHLHEKGIVHRDLKPENVMLDARGDYKLTDFGTARALSGTAMNDTTGTMLWMAPEVFNGEEYDQTCDVWSIGVMMLEMLGMRLPHLRTNRDMIGLTTFFAELGTRDVDLPAGLNRHQRDFATACLHTDSKKRPAVSTLLMHPFILEEPLPDGEEPAVMDPYKPSALMSTSTAEDDSDAESDLLGDGMPQSPGGVLTPMYPPMPEHHGYGSTVGASSPGTAVDTSTPHSTQEPPPLEMAALREKSLGE